MIKEVTIERTTYNELPHKFEAGTRILREAWVLVPQLTG